VSTATRIPYDGSRGLREQPGVGHNRWHPEVEPVARVRAGEEITLETGDAADAQLSPQSSHEDVARVELGRAHPLTGPVFVEGAEPGDLLEVELVDLVAREWGWTALIPGFGFLADLFPDPYLVHWRLAGGAARSDSLPGIAVPADVFPGTIGLAPAREDLERAKRREEELGARGGAVAPPMAEHAFPPQCTDGLRTIPPREWGGNMDVRQLTRGAKLYLPVSTPGALFSVGDVHYAQGDGEVCGTGVEICAAVTVRFRLHKQGRFRTRFPYFEAPPKPERRAIGFAGLPIADERNESMDLTLATRNALIAAIDWLEGERGLDRRAAYCLCSAAVDLRISEVVDVPNAIVSALVPLDLFES
jgi:formamidase